MKLLIAVRSQKLAEDLAAGLAGHDTHICHNGQDGQTMLETLKPDIFLLDLSLPGADGLTLLEKCRHKPARIFALTNLASPKVMTQAAKAGVERVFLLPCKTALILQALTEKAPALEG